MMLLLRVGLRWGSISLVVGMVVLRGFIIGVRWRLVRSLGAGGLLSFRVMLFGSMTCVCGVRWRCVLRLVLWMLLNLTSRLLMLLGALVRRLMGGCILGRLVGGCMVEMIRWRWRLLIRGFRILVSLEMRFL